MTLPCQKYQAAWDQNEDNHYIDDGYPPAARSLFGQQGGGLKGQLPKYANGDDQDDAAQIEQKVRDGYGHRRFKVRGCCQRRQ